MKPTHTRVSSVNMSPVSPVPRDMYHRSQPVGRPMASMPRLSPSPSRVNLTAVHGTSRATASRPSHLLPSTMRDGIQGGDSGLKGGSGGSGSESTPSIYGMPLKYVSLVVLAVQNAALSIVMHYSRVTTSPSRSYSAASAVLFNELLKGSISFLVAVWRVRSTSSTSRKALNSAPIHSPLSWSSCIHRVNAEIFSRDCWKLSIPAILYVIQNSLQFVAISNLPVASFQVTYQMKILTTAAFSVAMLGKRLSSTKWIALLFLAIGVGIVQIQTATVNPVPSQATNIQPEAVGSAAAAAPAYMHVMHPLKGFVAVSAACFTSGLAGVYFEMVLKNSKSDLWVRNVQLSLFSIIPALLPVLYSSRTPDSQGMISDLFRNFGGWAWGTVAIQVMGGLVTAVVIKYSDNIMKGFATSLSIILSFLASVVLFDFRITPAFVLGSSTVLAATWMYNQPSPRSNENSIASEKITPFPGSPITANEPIIGQFHSEAPTGRKLSPFSSSQSIASVFSLAGPEKTPPVDDGIVFGGESKSYLLPPYNSPYPSRSPSPSFPPLPPPSSSPVPTHNPNVVQGEWRQ